MRLESIEYDDDGVEGGRKGRQTCHASYFMSRNNLYSILTAIAASGTGLAYLALSATPAAAWQPDKPIDPCDINPDACGPVDPEPAPIIRPSLSDFVSRAGPLFGNCTLDRIRWFQLQLIDSDKSNDQRARYWLENLFYDEGLRYNPTRVMQFEDKYHLPHIDNITVLGNGSDGNTHWYDIGEKDAAGNITNATRMSVTDRIPP